MEEKVRHWGIALILVAIGASLVIGIIETYIDWIIGVMVVVGIAFVALRVIRALHASGWGGGFRP